MRTQVWTAALAALLFGGVTMASAADVFRMETEVFVGGDSKPVVEYLTLFTESAIYDFRLTKPEELSVFDLQRNRIVLLDPVTKCKATVSTDEILQFTAAIKTEVDDANPVFFAAAHPQLESSTDEETQWLTLSSKHLTYRVKGSKPKQSSATRRYQEFADWSARLSAMRLGNLPPFARIELNKAAADRGWLPEEVERVINPGKLTQRKQEVRSTHLVNWLLSDEDRKKVEKVGDQLSSYREVSIADFRDAGKVTKAERR